jgi:hypothetical protein
MNDEQKKENISCVIKGNTVFYFILALTETNLRFGKITEPLKKLKTSRVL